MYFLQQPQPEHPPTQTPKNPTLALGKKQILIPHNLTKIVYRQGEGSGAKAGACIQAYYSCHIIDGRELIKKRTRKIFSLGLGRLIEGLELGLLGARMNQKFVLIVAAEYGYQGHGQGGDLLLPRGEKLVFEFDVIGVQYLAFREKSEPDALIQIGGMQEKVTKMIKAANYNQASTLLQQISQKIQSLKYPKWDLRLTVQVKKSLISLRQQQPSQALQHLQPLLNQTHSNGQQDNIHVLILLSRIYRALNDYRSAGLYLRRCEELYGGDERVRGVCAEYRREIGEEGEGEGEGKRKGRKREARGNKSK